MHNKKVVECDLHQSVLLSPESGLCTNAHWMIECIQKYLRVSVLLFFQKYWIWSFIFLATEIYKSCLILICILLIKDEYLFPYVIPSYLSSKGIVFVVFDCLSIEIFECFFYLMSSLCNKIFLILCILIFIFLEWQNLYFYNFIHLEKDCFKYTVIEVCLLNI